MLGGAIALVLTHRAGVVFLILFTSCTALMAVLMAGVTHPRWPHARRHRIHTGGARGPE